MSQSRPSAEPNAPPSAVGPGRPGGGVYPRSALGQEHEGISTGRDVAWEPLVDYRRNDISETTIHGAVAWASGGDIIHSFGGNVLCYGRSMMKPFMMKAFASESWTMYATSGGARCQLTGTR